MPCIFGTIALAGLLLCPVSADDGVDSAKKLAEALVGFYEDVGQREKAPSTEKAKELLELPKWKGNEMKMFKSLQTKYAGQDAALSRLEQAFNSFTEAEVSQLQAKLAQMRLQKEVLEGINKINGVVRTLQAIGLTDDAVFDDLKQSAEEGHNLLDSINNEESWEGKLKLVKQGLSKRSEWIEQLTMVKDAMSKAQEEIDSTKAVETPEKEEPEQDEMDDPEVLERTAKVMMQAVRAGKPEMVAKVMGALAEKPEILTKLVMWPDERTGANLLHWCGFYGKEVHAALAQTFMMVPGVNASVSDKHRHTPCHTACTKNHPAVLEQLMMQDTQVGATPCDPFSLGPGANCLHLAAQGGFTEILKLLSPRLSTDMLNLVTSGGASAMSLADESGSVEAVEILNEAAKRLLHKASDEL